ncbi:MAG TPA: ketopantoate reductase family protein [Dehalococcoidia bacterium]|jgi:2-dehydropantoate 2-reductase|nr:ketopantoate reductase family protein [Dehalococcoidia bacterium]HIK98268.1 ketopantoate reductase family protein [Dehalococcoidia bacterium]
MGPRIGIIGGGAIGGYTGGMLTKAGHDVTIVDQWPEHVAAVKANGLTIRHNDGEINVPANYININELQSIDDPFDYVFVAVKSYDTEWAAMLMRRYLKPDGAYVDFQNGINDYRLAETIGAENALGCVITIAAGCYEPGIVLRTDTNPLAYKIGEQDGSDTPRVRELVEVISSASGGTYFTDNLWGERWAKLAINCMVNPMAGITGLTSDKVRTDPRVRDIRTQVGAEVIRVGRALGHTIGDLLGVPAQMFVDAAEGRNIEDLEIEMDKQATNSGVTGRASFLQDVIKHRRTEIEFLNGFVSEQGKKTGVPTPFCDALVAVVREAGVGKLEPNPDNLAPVATLLQN